MTPAQEPIGCWMRHVPIVLIALTMIGLVTTLLFASQGGIQERLRLLEQAQAAQAIRDERVLEKIGEVKKELADLRAELKAQDARGRNPAVRSNP
jgi:hypothetical protein